MQRTISQIIRFSGVGLHSGHTVDIKMIPHHINGGIIFRRCDLSPTVDIPAHASLVNDTTLSSCLSNGQYSIRTVEHIMSALAGLGIDNIIIELSADEVPIMDGSAAPFINQILSAGMVTQNTAKQFIKVTKPVSVVADDKTASLTPYDGFNIDFEIDFSHPAFVKDKQKLHIELSSGQFVTDISEARTFGFLRDIELLRKNNLALGGSLDNAIVIDEEKVMNHNGLRFDDEFVRHKVLDAVGDLYLAGHQILGTLTAYKSGHHLNNLLVRKLLNSPDCYEMVTYDVNQTPMIYMECMAIAAAS